MNIRRNLIQLCLLAAVLLMLMKSNAAAQVVTTNADSGPGTLRDAISNATSGASSPLTRACPARPSRWATR